MVMQVLRVKIKPRTPLHYCIEEGVTTAEAAVEYLGSVDCGSIGFLATVASDVGNNEDTGMM